MLGTCEKPSSVSELEEQLDLVASYYKLLAQRNVPQVTKAQYTELCLLMYFCATSCHHRASILKNCKTDVLEYSWHSLP